jgi:SAM-dependent methyltransferase
MSYTGPQFFDDEQIFATYMQRRTSAGSANNVLEWPIMSELIGAVQGLRVLDLGCGDATFGRDALTQGCASYLGLEGSQKMAELGRQTLVGTAGQVIHTSMESWAYPVNHFDLVISRMALHYVADIAALFAHIYAALSAGGRFVFSIEHPVITSCSNARPDGEGKRQGWLVDDYFNTGPRVVKWLGGEVIKVHHTVEDYFWALQSAGFVVTALRESRPQRVLFTDESEYLRRQRIPLMLFLVGQRDGAHTI